jgi:two-component system OmpR family sensor kinase
LKQSEKINLSIDSHGLSKIEVTADANYLSMLINNLIQNAMQHCRSEVRIDINQQDKLVILSVADDGKGVPESERNRILKPFIRGSEASGKNKGYGIGLAIVQRVLHWHEGYIEVGEDERIGGAKFVVHLPID